MNSEILTKDRMVFFDRAMKAQRAQLLSEMADAVCECRAALDAAVQLNETGEIGLFRLVEIWSAIHSEPDGIILEGTETQILSDVLAQVYACLSLHPLEPPVGMAIYVELRCMMEELADGGWFE